MGLFKDLTNKGPEYDHGFINVKSLKGANPTLCSHIRNPSLVQATNQWVTLPMSIYCILVYSLCYILLVSSLGHACVLYTNVTPIWACPLILALEGG